MAGGEGTRLRPLTSNCPKPMLPLANRPMMEHIVHLLKEHGIDEIVVTVAFLANQIRTYFGDGSEFGVRMVYATEDPCRSAPPARSATRWTSSTRPSSSSRATCSPTSTWEGAGVPPREGAMATIGLVRWRTRSSSASSSPARTARSSGSWRSRRGARCSATPSTPASSCWSPRSSTSSPRAQRRLLRARCSRRCWPPASPCSVRSPRATGRTSAPWRPTCPPTRTSSTARCTVDVPGFLGSGVWLGEGAEIQPRRPDRSGFLHHRRELQDRGRVRGRRLHRARRQRAGPRRRATWSAACARQRLPRRWRSHPRCGHRSQQQTCARGARCDDGVVIGDECFVGDDAHVGGREDLPVQDRRGRRHRQLLDRLGVQGGPQPVRPRRRLRAWPTSTSAPSWRPGSPWRSPPTLRKDTTVVTSRDSSRAARMLKRAMMAGPQRQRRQRARPRGGQRARHPVPVPSPVDAAGGSPSVRLEDDSQSVMIRFFDDRRHRHHRGRPAQDRAPLQPRGLPPGPRRARSATSASRPERSSSTPSPSRPPSTSRPCPTGLQAGGRLRLRRHRVRDAQRARQARCRRPRR
jgi:mannose-1-phosphate guanylyltransferase/phosphomannomutase